MRRRATKTHTPRITPVMSLAADLPSGHTIYTQSGEKGGRLYKIGKWKQTFDTTSCPVIAKGLKEAKLMVAAFAAGYVAGDMAAQRRHQWEKENAKKT